WVTSEHWLAWVRFRIILREAGLHKVHCANYGAWKKQLAAVNADKHGYSMRCLYSPAHQKGERLRCINGLIHLHKSAFICG
ncbi:MAG TPA: hypothetical protein VJ437_05945, partial [Acidiferrobacterales bacterium]|nr:hypothetical protein [Acidiferrobacterales bacterium]